MRETAGTMRTEAVRHPHPGSGVRPRSRRLFIVSLATICLTLVASAGGATVAPTARAATVPAPSILAHAVPPLTEVNLQTYLGNATTPIDYTSTTGITASSQPGFVTISFGPDQHYSIGIRTSTVGASASVNVSLPGGLGFCDSTVGEGGGGGQLDALAMSDPSTVTSAAIQFECVRTDPYNPGIAIGTIAFGLEPSPTTGYYLFGDDGSVTGFGNNNYVNYVNGLDPPTLNAAVVGMATTPTGAGYWMAAADGGIFAYGDAGFHGSAGNIQLQQPIVGMTSTSSGGGYWMVAADGGIFSYGDATFEGSTGNIRLNDPIVGMARTADDKGYWLVASDGGIFAFGDAGFYGSMGGHALNKPVVGMAATPDGKGYWLVASDGGVFAFGDAGFYGSTGNITLNQPIVGMTASADGKGYWFTASDGGVFAYGDAPFRGSLASLGITDVVGMAR